jgi:hypothetical protein
MRLDAYSAAVVIVDFTRDMTTTVYHLIMDDLIVMCSIYVSKDIDVSERDDS